MFGIWYRSVERMVDSVYIIIDISSVPGGGQRPSKAVSGAERQGK